MDGLTAAYFVAFVAGAGFSIVSWLLGAVGSHGDSGGQHGDVDAQGDADAASDEASSGHLHLDVHLGGHGAEAGGDAAGHALEAGGHATGHGPVVVHGHAPALGHGHGHALAHAHGQGGAPAHAHAHGTPQHGPAHGDASLAARVVSPLLNLSSLAALSCVGGGAGLIARRAGAGAPLSFLVAIPSGLAAAYLIGSLIAWLRRESHFKEPTEIGGTLATVLAPVSSEHLGEVMYLIEDVRMTLPARSSSTTVLEPGAEVVILDVKNGIARVGAATELLGIEPAPAAVQRRSPQGEKEGPK
jgi:hypothetical protein